MPLYGCMTHRPACPTSVDFHSWSSLLKHVFPPASIMSCHVLCLQAVLHLTYTVHMHICSRHLLIPKKKFSSNICDIYRCPYRPLVCSAHRVNNTAWLASRFQCTFHQLTGLVTLSPELLNLGLNAVGEHRGWTTAALSGRPRAPLFLCLSLCVGVYSQVLTLTLTVCSIQPP